MSNKTNYRDIQNLIMVSAIDINNNNMNGTENKAKIDELCYKYDDYSIIDFKNTIDNYTNNKIFENINSVTFELNKIFSKAFLNIKIQYEIEFKFNGEYYFEYLFVNDKNEYYLINFLINTERTYNSKNFRRRQS